MKKTLIALAALASTAAFAQSSVTISGRLDLGHANIKTTNSDGEVSKSSTLAGDQHGRTTSRLTFSGTEDLGGGLKASFNYETRLNPDNTTSAGLDRTRNMFLNLSGDFGGVTIGTFLNSIDAIRGYSAATYSAPGGDFLANHTGLVSTQLTDAELNTIFGLTAGANGASQRAVVRAALANGLSGRSTNAIAYTSPTFGGFKASLGLVNEKTSVTDNGVTTSLGKGSGYIASIAYANGPLNAQLAIGQAKVSAIVPTAGTVVGVDQTESKSKDTALAVSYNLGVAVPYFQYERTSGNASMLDGAAVDRTGFKTRAYELGAKFPMGAFTPYVSLGRGKIDVAFDGTAGDNIKTSAWQIGTTYDLSKRTYLYAATGMFKAKTVDFSEKTTGYKFGLVHQF